MQNPLEKLYKFCPNCTAPLTKKTAYKKTIIVCPKCNFIFWSNPRPCVSAIISNKEGAILLLRRAGNPLKAYWCLPGGVVDYDESPEQSIIREVKEETNLDLAINRLLGVYLIDNDPRGNGLDVIYLGSTNEEEVRLSDEHSEYRFFSPSELPELIAYKHKKVILDFKKI